MTNCADIEEATSSIPDYMDWEIARTSSSWHTAATWMAEAGVPMRKIALYLGHKSEETTAKVYAHHSPDYLKEASEALEG